MRLSPAFSEPPNQTKEKTSASFFSLFEQLHSMAGESNRSRNEQLMTTICPAADKGGEKGERGGVFFEIG